MKNLNYLFVDFDKKKKEVLSTLNLSSISKRCEIITQYGRNKTIAYLITDDKCLNETTVGGT